MKIPNYTNLLAIQAGVMVVMFGLSNQCFAFNHPGIFFTTNDLARIKTEVAAKAQPWYAAWQSFIADKHAADNWGPLPQGTMSLYSGESTGQINDDSQAAFYNALEWYVTGQTTNLTRAKIIIDAWTSTLTNVPIGDNQELAIGNAAETFANAGEILTYTSGSGFTTTEQTALKNMMENLFYPNLTPPFGAYNHGTTQMKGLIALAVYCNDTAKFNSVVTNYEETTTLSSGYAGLMEDILTVNGMNAEMWRDGVHPAGGVGGLAETALIYWNSSSSSSLLTNYDNLLLTGTEYIARWDSGYYCDFLPYTNNAGTYEYQFGETERSINATLPSQIMYNQFTRLGISCPWTAWFAQEDRTNDYAYTLFFTLSVPSVVTVPGGNLGMGTGGGTIANGTYRLLNRASGLVMGTASGGESDGSLVQENTNNGASYQDWVVSSLGSGNYSIVNAASGRYLEVPNNSTTNGTALDIWDYFSGTSEEWYFTSTSSGYMEISSTFNNLLPDCGSPGGAGSDAEQWPANDNFGQQWLFVSTNHFATIQATNYNNESGISTEISSDTGGGMDVNDINNGDYTEYNSINLTGALGMSFRISSAGNGGTIEVHEGSTTGTLLGTALIPITGGWGNWQTVSCGLTGATGTQNIYLVFKGNTGGIAFLYNLHWFQLL